MKEILDIFDKPTVVTPEEREALQAVTQEGCENYPFAGDAARIAADSEARRALYRISLMEAVDSPSARLSPSCDKDGVASPPQEDILRKVA